MGRAAIPSRRYWKMKEEHEKVVRLMEDLERKYLKNDKVKEIKVSFWKKILNSVKN